jgi:hypothetical protein
LSDDPGVTVVLPFAGPRLRVAYAFGNQQARFVLGVLGAWESNFWREERNYAYVETPWLCWDSCESYTTQAHHVVGGNRFLAALTFGGAIGVR